MELHAAEEAKKRLVNEKSLLEEKFSIVEKKRSDEVSSFEYIRYLTIICMLICNSFLWLLNYRYKVWKRIWQSNARL